MRSAASVQPQRQGREGSVTPYTIKEDDLLSLVPSKLTGLTDSDDVTLRLDIFTFILNSSRILLCNVYVTKTPGKEDDSIT